MSSVVRSLPPSSTPPVIARLPSGASGIWSPTDEQGPLRGGSDAESVAVEEGSVPCSRYLQTQLAAPRRASLINRSFPGTAPSSTASWAIVGAEDKGPRCIRG